MIKYYETLNKAIEKNGFNLESIGMANGYLMARHKNGGLYISHICHTDDGWVIDTCRHYDDEQIAIESMVMFYNEELKSFVGTV